MMASGDDSKWRHWALCSMYFTNVDIRRKIIGVYERERLLGIIRQSRVKALGLRLGNTVKIDRRRYWSIHPASEEFFLRYRRWINGEGKEKPCPSPYEETGKRELLYFGLSMKEMKRTDIA